MKPAAFAYSRPERLDDALALLGGGSAKPCTGTQSLGPMLNLRLAQPEHLVDLSRLPELHAVQVDGERLLIGAAVTHATIEDDRDGRFGRASAGLLPAVAAGIAYRAVRQRGTLGGSLAHADPAADWVNTACLLGAGLHIAGPRGRRRVAAGAFFTGPFSTVLADDELLLAVDWPLLPPGTRWRYHKQCRKPGEFAQALVASWHAPGQARLVLGALGRPPHLVQGHAEVEALRQPGGQRAVFDALGLDDPFQRRLLATLIERTLTPMEAAA